MCNKISFNSNKNPTTHKNTHTQSQHIFFSNIFFGDFLQYFQSIFRIKRSILIRILHLSLRFYLQHNIRVHGFYFFLICFRFLSFFVRINAIFISQHQKNPMDFFIALPKKFCFTKSENYTFSHHKNATPNFSMKSTNAIR